MANGKVNTFSHNTNEDMVGLASGRITPGLATKQQLLSDEDGPGYDVYNCDCGFTQYYSDPVCSGGCYYTCYEYNSGTQSHQKFTSVSDDCIPPCDWYPPDFIGPRPACYCEENTPITQENVCDIAEDNHEDGPIPEPGTEGRTVGCNVCSHFWGRDKVGTDCCRAYNGYKYKWG
jgi:hypothetical protein